MGRMITILKLFGHTLAIRIKFLHAATLLLEINVLVHFSTLWAVNIERQLNLGQFTISITYLFLSFYDIIHSMFILVNWQFWQTIFNFHLFCSSYDNQSRRLSNFKRNIHLCCRKFLRFYNCFCQDFLQQIVFLMEQRIVWKYLNITLRIDDLFINYTGSVRSQYDVGVVYEQILEFQTHSFSFLGSTFGGFKSLCFFYNKSIKFLPHHRIIFSIVFKNINFIIMSIFIRLLLILFHFSNVIKEDCIIN